jgi:hypothetical protein
MPKIVATAELEAVLRAVAQHPQGAGIEIDAEPMSMAKG